MSALHAVAPMESGYQFKRGARVPHGVTVEGIIAERQCIKERYGRVTAREAAEAVLASPEAFPHLRPWAPEDAQTALRLCMEQGVRYAFNSIVKIDMELSPGFDEAVQVRVFWAVPVEGAADLSYEEVTIIKQDPEQKAFLIRELRQEARTFSRRLETVLAELESLV